MLENSESVGLCTIAERFEYEFGFLLYCIDRHILPSCSPLVQSVDQSIDRLTWEQTPKLKISPRLSPQQCRAAERHLSLGPEQRKNPKSKVCLPKRFDESTSAVRGRTRSPHQQSRPWDKTCDSDVNCTTTVLDRDTGTFCLHISTTNLPM